MNRAPENVRIPGCTYRLQFNRGFTLAQAADVLAYLRDLGITDVYASPLFQAGSESTHGYDVCCFSKLSPNIGTEEDFAAFSRRRRELNLGLLLDMVPNHMGAALSNGWWLDVLEHGPASRYADFFDINWNPPNPALRGKVLLPVLGDHYAQALESGQLKLAFSQGKFWIRYFERSFPVNAESLPESLRRIVGQASGLSEAGEQEATQFNGTPGDARSFDALHQLIQKQHYRLAFWRVASEEINYRRFFDVTELVSMRMERADVFEAVHQAAFKWLETGDVTGLRIDHPDGLRDPKHYFERLQAHRPVYVVAEKILSGDEQLPGDWPVHGTTGYDFLNRLNGIFVDSGAERAMTEIYESFLAGRTFGAPSTEADSGREGVGRTQPVEIRPFDFDDLLIESKKRVLESSLISELESLTHRLQAVAASSRMGVDFTFSQLKSALKELIAAFPVYRTYLSESDTAPSAADRAVIDIARVRCARVIDSGLLDFLRQLLTLELLRELEPDGVTLAREFVARFQQLTGPVTAKGLEDTAFYNYHRLISLNEVGGEPAHFGVSISDFHRFNSNLAANWPHTLLATATHDTKRGEDARARINVLSEIPNEWAEAVTRWKQFNADKTITVSGRTAPVSNDEYLLYQSIVGALPHNANDLEVLADFRDRVAAFMQKAIREAKANTSWLNPDRAYEAAVEKFVRSALTDNANNLFLDDLRRFTRRVAFFGQINSLAQIVLKLTVPGVPDTYQGTELWDFSFVDPDNRRPVDFQARRRLLAELANEFGEANADGAVPEVDDSGKAKLFVIWRTLQLRKQLRELFQSGDYLPLSASGAGANHVAAFARQNGNSTVIAVVPRLNVRLTQGEERMPISENTWRDTRLLLPDTLETKRYRNVFTGEVLQLDANRSLRAASVLNRFPVAVLSSLDNDANPPRT